MKIDHLTYYGGDLDQAKKFYGQILGLDTKLVQGKLWVKIGDEYLLHLSNDKALATGGNCHFAIYANNLPRLAKEIEERGGEIFNINNRKITPIKQIDTVEQFFIKDHASNLIEFIEK